MGKKLEPHGKHTIRVWGMGYVTPRTAAVLVVIVIILCIIVFGFHI